MKNKLYCFDKLEELFSLYEKVRQAVVLSENFNKERKIHIAPINQMRCALDHIFKAINSVDKIETCDYELKEAKEHLDISFSHFSNDVRYSRGDNPVTLLKYFPKTDCDGKCSSSLICCIVIVVEISIALLSSIT